MALLVVFTEVFVDIYWVWAGLSGWSSARVVKSDFMNLVPNMVRFFWKEKGLSSFYFWLCVLGPNHRLIPRGHMLL